MHLTYAPQLRSCNYYIIACLLCMPTSYSDIVYKCVHRFMYLRVSVHASMPDVYVQIEVAISHQRFIHVYSTPHYAVKD